MRCCMPLCENTSENVSKCDRITFHGFPSEEHLRNAWLRALVQQDSDLPDSSVVCSQHFLDDDFCETERGSRQLRTCAVPSTVLVCVICLDTDRKMFPVHKYNLEEAYEKLTGHPLFQLCDGGILKQTLCVQCAQILRNFCRFRDKSLRARSLLMELLEKHELITAQHIQKIKHENNQLRNNLVSIILGPDHSDMYIKEKNSDEDRQTDSEENVYGITVKTECSDDSQTVDEDTQMINEENTDCGKVEITLDPLEYGSTLSMFTSTVGSEEFPHKHGYSAHVGMQLQGGVHPASTWAHSVVTPSFTNRITPTGYEACTTEKANTTENSERAPISKCGASDKQAPQRKNTDSFKYPLKAKVKVESSTQSLQAASSDSLNVHTAQHRERSESGVATAHNEPAASILSETEPGTSGNSSCARTFTCDVCQRAFTRKYYLIMHMMTHTGEKPYSCELCSYKCASNGNLLHHMKTHTGEKPYPCKICGHQFAQKRTLVDHMKTHTGEKPYSCEICSYKSTQKKNLARHMRTHTGEKPYACEICSHKSTTKSSLNHHMRIHTGEKPFSCTICEYKCIQKGSLVNHMSTHTGEKPYSCNICGFKFAQKGSLVGHMRTHTGEKPYCCDKCGYKSTSKGTLNRHVMRKHC